MTELPQWIREALRDPETLAELVEVDGPNGLELVSVDAEEKNAYPVRGGVPVMLPDEARDA